MARINLLPWREEQRQQKKKDFLTAMGALIVATLVGFGFIHTHIQDLQTYQTARNKILEDELVILDKKLGEIKNIEDTKNKLLAKIDLIQKLQESRPEVVHLLDEIPKTTPDGVFLASFAQTDQKLVFIGKSQSNARVSAFMRAIDASDWLQAPVLEIIAADNGQSAQSDFTLKATLGKKNIEATATTKK